MATINVVLKSADINSCSIQYYQISTVLCTCIMCIMYYRFRLVSVVCKYNTEIISSKLIIQNSLYCGQY
jgi:hypothetical protein